MGVTITNPFDQKFLYLTSTDILGGYGYPEFFQLYSKAYHPQLQVQVIGVEKKNPHEKVSIERHGTPDECGDKMRGVSI